MTNWAEKWEEIAKPISISPAALDYFKENEIYPETYQQYVEYSCAVILANLVLNRETINSGDINKFIIECLKLEDDTQIIFYARVAMLEYEITYIPVKMPAFSEFNRRCRHIMVNAMNIRNELDFDLIINDLVAEKMKELKKRVDHIISTK